MLPNLPLRLSDTRRQVALTLRKLSIANLHRAVVANEVSGQYVARIVSGHAAALRRRYFYRDFGGTGRVKGAKTLSGHC